MAIVNERHNAARPVQVDPKTGKPLSTTPARAASPTLGGSDGDSSNTGFFGSFFAAKNKKKAAAMEPPPPTLKASGTLSEREGIEVEVISKWPFRCWWANGTDDLEQNSSSSLTLTLSSEP
jgi:dynamin 1-like protein